MFSKNLSIFLALLTIFLVLTLSSCRRSFDVTFELSGGVMPEDDGSSFSIGDEYILPTPTKPNHEFDGWYLTKDFSGEPITSIILGESENLTLYAKFVRLVKVTYKTEGGVTTNPTLVRQDEIVELSDATHDCLTFEGWYTEKEYKNRLTKLIYPTNDLTLYAKYLSRYSIAYDTAGGVNNQLNPEAYDSENGALLFAPEREGYEFLGWYNLLTDERVSFIYVGMSGDFSLIAKWKPIIYSIEWELNGGSADTKLAKTYTHGVGIDGRLPEVAREGSIFLGWYNIEGGKDERIEFIDENTRGDLSLEARFYTNDKIVVKDLFSLTTSTKAVEAEQVSIDGHHIEIPEELRPLAEAGVLVVRLSACFSIGIRTQGSGSATLSVFFFAGEVGHSVLSKTAKGGGNGKYGRWSYSTASVSVSLPANSDGLHIGYGYYLTSGKESADATTDIVAICDSVSYSFYIIK